MTPQHGLPALIARARSGLPGLDACAIALVFGAGIITILHKSGIPVPHYAAAFGVALGVAALLYEMNATTYALRSWWNGRIGGALGWACVWAVAFLYSMNQWIGAASETEDAKAGIQKAAYTIQVDAAKTEGELTAKLNALQQRVAMAPQRSPEQADAAIKRAKADRLWTSTSGCTENVNGPKTRAFCDGYASAVADLEGGKALITDREELKAVEKQLAEVRTARASKPAVVSEDRQDLVILTKFAGVSYDDARVMNALGSILAISIFLSLATALREMEHLRASGPRKRIFSLAWLRNMIAWMSGRDTPKPDRVVIREEVREKDARFDRLVGHLQNKGLISA